MRLSPEHPALSEGRTIHPKYVLDPAIYNRGMLKCASSNKKLTKGKKKIKKGRWKGMRLFSLTLEERATCPPSCHHWDDCYGNNMAFAQRFDHNSPAFLPSLAKELCDLAEKNPNGFVVRLHVLGDFYSAEYCKFWWLCLRDIPELRIYGYTARNTTAFGWLYKANREFADRCVIRTSRSEEWNPRSPFRFFAGKESSKVKGIVCPEQTGKTESCLTCGLCWSIKNTILFKDH